MTKLVKAENADSIRRMEDVLAAHGKFPMSKRTENGTVGRRVTMTDVAEASGVSAATVSLALRNKPGIPDETRRRILNTAESLGYRYKATNATPTHHELQSLGLVVKSEYDANPTTNPFYSLILAGIEEACRQKKINLLYATLPVDENNRPIEIPRLLQEVNTDGLLVVGAYVDDRMEQTLQQVGLPMVLVDGYAYADHYDSVVSDNFRGAVQAVRHLIENGHRHIGMIGSRADGYPSLAERRQGYLHALQSHGIHTPYFADCPLDAESVKAATVTLLQEHPEITALFGCNDETVLQAIRAAKSLGRTVPDSLSVVGFDDIALAQHLTPALTTMHVDKVTMGRLAVQLLIHRIEFPDTDPVTTVLRPQLIERQSVQALGIA